MTDSIKSILTLSGLPKADLEHVPVEKTARFKPKRNSPVIPFDAWQTIASPLTGNGMKVKVMTNGDFTPVALVVECNLPNATVGQNAELGHSVYAANTVALDFLKIFLAKHGVPPASLERLTVAQMKAGSVTITYLIPVPNGRTAQSILEEIKHRFAQFFPLSKDERYGGSFVGSKSSLTPYLHQRGWSTRAYSTPAHKIDGDESDPVHKQRVQFAKQVVRMELTLTAEELRKHGLQEVTAWEIAHESGIYKMLFDCYIRNAGLRLHERLRTDKPKQSDVLKLNETNRYIITGYLDGKSLKDCNLLKRPSKIAAQKAHSAAVRTVLKLLRIDMNIDWVEHRKLGNTWMEKVIVYAGDHHPPQDHVSTSFCQENLPAIRKQLQDTLARQLSAVEGSGRNNVASGIDLSE